MKVVAMKCPNCNADVTVDMENKTAFCQYCGQQLFLQDETQHVEHDISEDAGYRFEKGRQRAQAEADQNAGGIRCPVCSGSKVTIKREQQGYVSAGKSKRIAYGKGSEGARESNRINYYRTVGVCQNCGYTWTISQDETPKKKMNIFLRIILWVCFFPFMLSYWFWTSDILKDKKIIKGIIIAAFWLFLLGGGSNSSKTEVPESSSSATEAAIETSESLEDADPEQTEAVESVVVSGTVGKFLKQYETISDSPFINLNKSLTNNKYFGSSYGYYCELFAVDDNHIRIMINETNENADLGVAGMKDIFRSCSKALGDGRSDDEIDAFFDDLISGNQISETESGIQYDFSPDVELSNGASRGHITLTGPIE